MRDTTPMRLVILLMAAAVAADDCGAPENKMAYCQEAGQYCVDKDGRKPGNWGCFCADDYSGGTWEKEAWSSACPGTLPPTPAPPAVPTPAPPPPPTPTPPTPSPPTPLPPTPVPPTPSPPTPLPPTPAPPTPLPPTPEPLGPFGCRIIDFCAFYQPSMTTDTRDCTCGECDDGYDVSPDETTCNIATPIPPTPIPATPVPTPAPPKGFTAMCDEVSLSAAGTFTVSYQLGWAGAEERAAVQFTATLSAATWGGIGLREAGNPRNTQMRGLDIIGFSADTLTLDDCETMTALTGKPQITSSANAQTKLVSALFRRGVASFTMWRYLANGYDFEIKDGMDIDFVRAKGSGDFGAASGHASSSTGRSIAPVSIEFCPELKEFVAARTPPPPPEAWDCDFIHNCYLYTPGPTGSPKTSCRCGLCDDGYVQFDEARRCVPEDDIPPPPSGPPTPAPTLAPAPFGCGYIENCDLYKPSFPGAPLGDCVCGRCASPAVPSTDGKACEGDVGPFGCGIIGNCTYYFPPQGRDKTACTCGLCAESYSPSADLKECRLTPTLVPNTAEPSTGEPTTGEPTTGEPVVPLSTGEPTTGEPTTGVPNTAIPPTYIPSTGTPSTGEPTTGDPAVPGSTGRPTTGTPNTAAPFTYSPPTASPSTGEPTTGEPTTGEPTTGEPTTGTPVVPKSTGEPTTGEPTTGGPTTGKPTTGIPNTAAPPTSMPQMAAPAPAQESIPMFVWVVALSVMLLCCLGFAYMAMCRKSAQAPERQDEQDEELKPYEYEFGSGSKSYQDTFPANPVTQSQRSSGSAKPFTRIDTVDSMTTGSQKLDKPGLSNVFDNSSPIVQTRGRRETTFLGAGRKHPRKQSGVGSKESMPASPSSGSMTSMRRNGSSPAPLETSPKASPKKKPPPKARKQPAGNPRTRIFTMSGYGNMAAGGGDDEHAI